MLSGITHSPDEHRFQPSVRKSKGPEHLSQATARLTTIGSLTAIPIPMWLHNWSFIYLVGWWIIHSQSNLPRLFAIKPVQIIAVERNRWWPERIRSLPRLIPTLIFGFMHNSAGVCPPPFDFREWFHNHLTRSRLFGLSNPSPGDRSFGVRVWDATQVYSVSSSPRRSSRRASKDSSSAYAGISMSSRPSPPVSPA